MAKKTSGSSNVHVEQAHPQKHIFNSSLNSASPPFYPSGSSSQDISAGSKRDPQSGSGNQNLSSFGEDNFSPSHGVPILRGKTVIDPLVQDRYVVDDAAQHVSGKNVRNLQLPASSSSAISATQIPQRGQGRVLTAVGHSTTSVNQLGRGSAQMQLPSVQRAAQTSAQSLHRASNQLSGQHSGGGSQASSPSHAQLATSSEVGESDSPRGSVKSMATVSGKSKAITQGSGRGSFLYGGAQVMGASGAMGLAHGDQNFPGTPALLPGSIFLSFSSNLFADLLSFIFPLMIAFFADQYYCRFNGFSPCRKSFSPLLLYVFGIYNVLKMGARFLKVTNSQSTPTRY